MEAKYVFLVVAGAAFSGLAFSVVHKRLPHFAEIPVEKLREWRPAPYLPAGQGRDWKLSQFTEGTGAMNRDVNHLVLERDGKAYDLIDKDDTWGFGNALSWKVDLVGDRLYIFDAHQNWEPGWFQINVKTNDWLLPRMGFEPDGTIYKIDVPAGVTVPHDSSPGDLFKIESGHLVPVKHLRDYDDLFEHLESGVYYLSPPGLGIRRVIDLERPMVRK